MMIMVYRIAKQFYNLKECSGQMDIDKCLVIRYKYIYDPDIS